MSLKSLSISAVGDISFNGIYRARPKSKDWMPWASLLNDLTSADCMIGNLESMITDVERVSKSKCTLKAAEHAASYLEKTGFDLLNLANNHAMDFGVDGLNDTLSVLKDIGIPFVGCGQNLDEAVAPHVASINNQRVGFLSFCDVIQKSHLYAERGRPGVAPLNEDSFQHVRNLRGQVDWLVVQLHWGTEMSQLPSPDERSFARRFVEAGADAIICHHQHVIQPLEVIDNTPVWYSLGNFAFSNEFWQGMSEDQVEFTCYYRMHELARNTCVAWMQLAANESPKCKLIPAQIHKSGRIKKVFDGSISDNWTKLCELLSDPAYEDHWKQEVDAAKERCSAQTCSRTLIDRIRTRAFNYGLIKQH